METQAENLIHKEYGFRPKLIWAWGWGHYSIGEILIESIHGLTSVGLSWALNISRAYKINNGPNV